MKGTGRLLLLLFVGLGPSNANAFFRKPAMAQQPAKKHGSFSEQLSAKSRSAPIENVLSVRGGALLPVEPTAKVFAAMTVLVNLHLVFFPKENGEFFSLPSTPYSDFKRRFIGYGGVAHALAVGLLLFDKASVPAAFAAGLLTMSVPGALSGDRYQQLAAAVTVAGIGLVSTFEDSSQLVKNFAMYGIASNFLFSYVRKLDALFCSSSMKEQLEGKAPDEDRLVTFYNRFVGHMNMGLFVFIYLVSGGMEIPKAFGYSAIPNLVNVSIQNFVTKDVKHFGVSESAQWLTLLFLISGVVIFTA